MSYDINKLKLFTFKKQHSEYYTNQKIFKNSLKLKHKRIKIKLKNH